MNALNEMDSFGFTAQLHHTASFPLLGKCLEVRTNSAGMLRAAHQTFGHWLALADEGHSDQIAPSDLIASHSERLRLDVVVMAESQDALQPFTYRLNGHTFIASSGPNMMTAQLDRGYAIAFVTTALIVTERYLQKQVLDTLGLLLATQHDREPIHAGAVVWQGKALLLAGPSKSGKSTLCYACTRAGFELMAEDVVYIQRQPALRLWGHSHQVHLLADAPQFFPELVHAPVNQLPNGKAKLAAAVAHTRRFAEAATLCLIERHPHPHSQAQPLPHDVALAALFAGVDEGFDLYPHAREAAAHLLSHSPCYRLQVGRDLDQTVDLLKTL